MGAFFGHNIAGGIGGKKDKLEAGSFHMETGHL